MKDFIFRLSNLIYWASFFLSIFFVCQSLLDFLNYNLSAPNYFDKYDNTKNLIAHIFIPLAVYLLGYGIRYLLAGKKDHAVLVFISNKFGKK